jgi:peptidoglycan/LPS O-acetylase OafA/YrhL
MIKQNGQIPSLNGLRAVSVILVIIYHWYENLPTHNLTTDIIFTFLGNGGLGVSTFFVISGYLITYLLRKEWEKKQTISLKGFYWRRVIRIFPAFYAYLIVIASLKYSGLIGISTKKLLTAATFSINYGNLWGLDTSGAYYWFVGHFWSLSLEEQFYLLWPTTLLVFGLKKSKNIALAIVLISPFIRVGNYFLSPSTRGQLGMMLHTHADILMAGCYVALAEGNARFESNLKRILNKRNVTIAFLLIFVASPILFYLFRGSYGVTIGFSLEAVCISLIMIFVIRNYDSTRVGLALNSKVLVYIGTLSYSLYLWQQLFLTPQLNTTFTGTFPFNLVACFCAAFISYNFVEKPFLKLKNKATSRGVYKNTRAKEGATKDELRVV